MAYLLITCFPAKASRIFTDFKEVGMLSSRPSRPYAKNLSAGAELGLDDQRIISRKWYIQIFVVTKCRVSLEDKGRLGII